jgi:hypothetical protein
VIRNKTVNVGGSGLEGSVLEGRRVKDGGREKIS